MCVCLGVGGGGWGGVACGIKKQTLRNTQPVTCFDCGLKCTEMLVETSWKNNEREDSPKPSITE